MNAKSVAILINLLGFVTGASLYAMLLIMVLGRLNFKVKKKQTLANLANNKLLLLTAILGFSWNIGAVAIYGLPDLGIDNTFPWLIAASFTTLGFLPAVVVHLILLSNLEANQKLARKFITFTAYCLSAIAGLMHFYVTFINELTPSHIALHILTFGFGSLAIALIFLTRKQPGWQRAFWITGLAVFAVSALHLSHHDAESYPWWLEMIGHHASLPLVIAILYQDYRFAFADIFLKRTISLVLLVVIVFSAYMAVSPLLVFGSNKEPEPLTIGLLLGLWVATALFYPKLRQMVVWFVDTIVLKRADYDNLRVEIARTIASYETPEEILAYICRVLTPILSAKQISFSLEEDMSLGNHTLTMLFPTTEMPQYYLVIGELLGGRRLLSDDLEMLEAVVLMVARRIDVVRVAHDRCKISLREQEISKLATEAELRALRAQLNPHFLFNALTTLGYLIQTAPDKAFETLMRLTGLLRGVLRRSAGEFASVGEEVELIKAYLDIEKTRFEERLQVKINVEDSLNNIRIPSLLIQPLVENAIKHGITPAKDGGEIAITVEKCFDEKKAEQIKIVVQDTGQGVSEFDLARGRKKGVGLANIERRLKCHYADEAILKVKSELNKGTTITVSLPFVAQTIINNELKIAKG
jgi:two-component system, LytTR family, sensor kinase